MKTQIYLEQHHHEHLAKLECEPFHSIQVSNERLMKVLESWRKSLPRASEREIWTRAIGTLGHDVKAERHGAIHIPKAGPVLSLVPQPGWLSRLWHFLWSRLKKWLLALLTVVLVMAAVPRSDAQIVNENLVWIAGQRISTGFYDTGNNALRVNVVAGGAGGGLAQLQVGRVSDGAFSNVGFFTGQQNVPVNCVVGCAGGSSTASDAFANPTTAGLTIAFGMFYNGTTWDRARGDTTSGLWVNCKNGCSAGSTTPADAFANPSNASNSWGLTAVWNGATWDRLRGDTTNGAFVNVKTSVLPTNAAQETGGNLASVKTNTDALGAKTDAAATQTDATSVSIVSVLKELSAKAQAPASTPVTGTFWQATQPVSGTFWQATQPVSTADGSQVTLGAKADAKSTATDTTAVTIMQVLKEISAMAQAPASTPVTGTFWQATQPVSGTTTANQGTANTAANAWPAKVTDGTNTAAVKAASTAVAAADPALAVGLSPNSPLPAGTNAIGGVTGTLTDNNAAPGANNIGALTGIARTDYRGGTAATAGRAVMPDVGTDGLLHTAALPSIRPATYRASVIWSPVATTATDVLRMPGNATNTVLVTQVMFSCTATTAGVQKVSVIKRSTAGSGGTSSNTAVAPMDSNYAAAVSVPVTYTVNPTVGTIVANVDDVWLGMMATGTASPNDIYIGNFRQKPIVLRGVAENLVISLNSVSIAGISCAASVEWMEITTITP